jgi:hypothetical protein
MWRNDWSLSMDSYVRKQETSYTISRAQAFCFYNGSTSILRCWSWHQKDAREMVGVKRPRHSIVHWYTLFLRSSLLNMDPRRYLSSDNCFLSKPGIRGHKDTDER